MLDEKYSVRKARTTCIPSESLFRQVNSLLIPKYISYATNRLPEKMLIKTIPEATTLSKMFHRKALEEWRELMRGHNRNIERGEKMGLLPAGRSPKSLKFDSLDNYMLRMHGYAYVEALLSIATFGERVLKARDGIQVDGVWCLEMPICIMHESWALMRKRVKMLVRRIELMLSSQDTGPFHESLTETLRKVSVVF
jgi:hypothetical protein